MPRSLGHTGRITVLFKKEALTSVRVTDGVKMLVYTRAPSATIEMFECLTVIDSRYHWRPERSSPRPMDLADNVLWLDVVTRARPFSFYRGVPQGSVQWLLFCKTELFQCLLSSYFTLLEQEQLPRRPNPVKINQSRSRWEPWLWL